MSDPLYAISMTAADLKLAAPREFDRFVETLKNFEMRCGDELYAAGPDGIFPAQGKAQLMRLLRQKIEDCLKIKATHETRK